MRLAEIMSAAGLELFAEIGLVLFAGIFAGVLIYTFNGRNRALFDRLLRAPLDDARETRAGEGDR
jgi:cbb3-type cytochrome oxidase subunit 3